MSFESWCNNVADYWQAWLTDYQEHHALVRKRRSVRMSWPDTTDHQVDRILDQRYCAAGNSLQELYPGYNNLFVTHQNCFTQFSYSDTLYNNIEDNPYHWCYHNCISAWRADWHEMTKTASGAWCINNIAGASVVVYAFESDLDYMNFMMRWG